MVGLALAYVAGITIATGTGSIFLITFQWPLIVTLSIAVVCWLMVAVITYTTFEEF
jgi:low affinity Fe/Cu permease